MITLANKQLTVFVSLQGAELHSIRCHNHEYLWNGDATFWARHSPVLFPIVGRVWDGQYRIDDHIYELGQHGFARDMEFTLTEQSDTHVWFRLEHTAETLLRYPYPFVLEVGYRLHDMSVDVLWRVSNPSDREMHFQIGAHPAFYWPDIIDGPAISAEPYMAPQLGYFRFDNQGTLTKSVLTEKGCIDPSLKLEVKTDNGLLPLTPELFSKDALVFEHDQVHSVELLDNEQKPYLRVEFPDMPLVGLWSSPGKHAPFVCIEPWCGRCDDVRYEGDFRDKPWINHLAPHGVFNTQYTITVE